MLYYSRFEWQAVALAIAGSSAFSCSYIVCKEASLLEPLSMWVVFFFKKSRQKSTAEPARALLNYFVNLIMQCLHMSLQAKKAKTSQQISSHSCEEGVSSILYAGCL